MTRKEWLVSQGVGSIGRGRISLAGLAMLDKARADGIIFSDDIPAKSKPVQATIAHAQSWGEPQDRRYPIGQLFVGYVDGKRVVVDDRQVCSPCGYSLGWHHCNSPEAVVTTGVLVRVKPL